MKTLVSGVKTITWGVASCKTPLMGTESLHLIIGKFSVISSSFVERITHSSVVMSVDLQPASLGSIATGMRRWRRWEEHPDNIAPMHQQETGLSL